MEINYTIYQTPVSTKYCFRSYEEAEKSGFTTNDYVAVWSDTITVGDGSDLEATLELLFMIFNTPNRPEKYHGRSLSVSDIVEVNGVKYYCDDVEWKKI